jgi:hypothetical protein
MKLKFGGLALSVGILGGLWTYVSLKLGLSTWAAFIGWAFFFVAGGDTKAILKAAVPTIVGVVFGYLAVFGLKFAGEAGIVAISVLVGVAALLLILLMNWSATALAPAGVAAFAGLFAFTFGQFKGKDVFAFDNLLWALIPMLIGVLLGWLSAKIPAWLTKPAPAAKAAKGA